MIANLREGVPLSNSQKRLAIYLPTLVGGGAERALLNLAVGFARQGYPIDFVLAQCEGAFMSQFPDSVRLVELNRVHLKAGRSVASLPLLVRYIRKERPRALITGLHANVIAIWAKQLAHVPLRLVISEQNTFSIHNQMLPIGYRQLMLALIRQYYPLADVVSGVSEGVADDLSCSARIPRDRVRVIHNPIITPELAVKVRENLDHPWFQPGEPPVILSVGRLDPQKDYPLLIKAFAQVHQFLPARLLILGEGPERAALEALVMQLGLEKEVSFPGFVPNPYPFMAHASLFVLSSRWEGLPTVLAEALYCDVPIVSTDCPSGPNEILQGGKYGDLVPVGDVECMADAIVAALKRNRVPAPDESWKPFELDTIVNQYLNAIENG
jgi:glycosyltransferase involved in cell wall biosynthesis